MYSDSDRAVFGPYWDGGRHVYADPLRVLRQLTFELGGEPNRWLADRASPDPPTAHRAREYVLQAARSSLQMAPFEEATGQGALEADVEAALSAYLGWMSEKKVSGPASPTCSPPTQGPAPPYYPPDLMGVPPSHIPGGSDCGSTAPG